MPRKHEFTVDAPIVSADDPHANLIAATVTSIEEQLGEQEGWDRPPRLFTLRILSDEDVETSFFPESSWNPGDINPADALCRLGGSLPPVPDAIVHTGLAQAPVCAIGFMCEFLIRSGTAPLPLHLASRAQRGERVNHLLPAPESRKGRIVHAVDLDQRLLHVVRRRGKQARVTVGELRSQTSAQQGIVLDSLSRIMHAMHSGKRVLPGQPG